MYASGVCDAIFSGVTAVAFPWWLTSAGDGCANEKISNDSFFAYVAGILDGALLAVERSGEDPCS